MEVGCSAPRTVILQVSNTPVFQPRVVDVAKILVRPPHRKNGRVSGPLRQEEEGVDLAPVDPYHDPGILEEQ